MCEFTDYAQFPPRKLQFSRENGIRNLDILVDRGGKVLRAAKIRGLPTTLLINAKGKEVARVLGAAVWVTKDVVAFIRRCLGQ